jgi:molybdopterin-guanine dinucleotide biosynthesis protein A
VASAWREIQPLLGCYQPSALAPLSEAARDPGIPLREAVAALAPARYEVEDPDCLFKVNTPAELLQASGLLDRRRAKRPPLR